MISAHEGRPDKFISLISKYCPNYETVLKLIKSAEDGMNMSRTDKVEIKYQTTRYGGLHSITPSDTRDGQYLSFTLGINGKAIYRREWTITNPVNLDFLRAGSELWIQEINNYFFEVLVHIFTTGVWQISRVAVDSVTHEITEEEDIATL
jgi:hypothetical protein